MRTIFLLIISNMFMTYAWYGHLKNNPPQNFKEIISLIFISWGIAFFEYIFMVPANNYFGRAEGFSAFQLKIIQEVISLVVFALFAIFFLKEKWAWNYAASFLCICLAVYFMFFSFKSN